MAYRGGNTHARLMCGAAMLALLGGGGVAAAEETAKFSIAPQPLASALNEFAVQSPWPILYTTSMTGGKMTAGVKETTDPELALNTLLAGTGLGYRREGDTFLIVRADQGPQSGSAAGGGAEVEALIVTAQKREEDIQDVPIAISAFTQEDLTRSQIAGGPDLITQVPNFTFTKTNFSSYSIQIRGIGTQAISATTDPAVAVAFNNTPFIRNRFFEQEFYDLARVEVLRGPQGTLYGRNATAGVVNIISQQPRFAFEAKLSGDVSNYNSSRLEGMINIPIVEDTVALRLAGAWTKRDGYATNEITGNPIDGRDLWSTRLSLRVAPNDRINANLIWEHFEESDDRLRSGKQLCKTHFVESIGGIAAPSLLTVIGDEGQGTTVSQVFSQGCERESLYSPDAFLVPNGLMLPYYKPLGAIGLPIARPAPYLGESQSDDLRVIESTVDPDYRAKSDLGQLQVTIDLTDALILTSETAYASDAVFSMQDFNRFNTAPGAWLAPDPNDAIRAGVLEAGPNGGIFCDPQLGCSDRLVAVDLARAEATQFSQEFRLASDFEGPFNFSLGANFLRADSLDRYYVFINSLTMIAARSQGVLFDTPYVAGQTDNSDCLTKGVSPGDPEGVYLVSGCIYIDPNPIGNLNDLGHNYFLSKNPYKLISYAVFGEGYYNITDRLKLTAGLRWTIDKKEAPIIPTWLLASGSAGYPVAKVLEQEWREPTGRLTVDWKPRLSFTDETLLYGSYAHGYKAGGANPPGYVRIFYTELGNGTEIAQASSQISATRPATFDPEFVDAFELGAKNTLLGGALTLNLAAFYYDYTAYQISEIVDRSAFNRNFDSTVWGAELEADWRPRDNLRLGLKAGYQKTRITDGERAVDLMDRTAGRDDWVVARPFPTYASSCVLPAYVLVHTGPIRDPGGASGGNPSACEEAYYLGLDPVTNLPFVPNPTEVRVGYSPNGSRFPLTTSYQGFNPLDASLGHNSGEGFYKELGGNELPNAPNWTATITGDYTVPLPNEWLATLHTDLHWQAESWWRVFNDHEYGKLDEYFTMNLAAIFTNEDAGWNIMAYIKNVTDETAITGAFLNSDDTGLTTNVFLTEPRLYGLRVTKVWSGGRGLPGFGSGDGPYPLSVELGGQVQRLDRDAEALTPGWYLGEDGVPVFSQAIDPLNVQERDLDWGDGREVRLIYRPTGSVWSASASFRSGEANKSSRVNNTEVTGPAACNFSRDWPIPYGPMLCDPTFDNGTGPGYYYNASWLITPTNRTNVEARSKEEHAIIDFEVGREVGLGYSGLAQSKLSAGMRYAQLQSFASTNIHGINNFEIQEGWLKYPASNDQYSATISAEREFEGAGPLLSWEAATNLVGNSDVGHLRLDGALRGGVLFGKQKVHAAGSEREGRFEGKYYYVFRDKQWNVLDEATPTPIEVTRSRSATVPLLDLSLGVSYEKQRFKVGAGYRWERYFDAIDGGFTTEKSYDRTIDGPYFKLSVGFGG